MGDDEINAVGQRVADEFSPRFQELLAEAIQDDYRTLPPRSGDRMSRAAPDDTVTVGGEEIFDPDSPEIWEMAEDLALTWLQEPRTSNT